MYAAIFHSKAEAAPGLQHSAMLSLPDASFQIKVRIPTFRAHQETFKPAECNLFNKMNPKIQQCKVNFTA